MHGDGASRDGSGGWGLHAEEQARPRSAMAVPVKLMGRESLPLFFSVVLQKYFWHKYEYF
jgi:hypothetical protein